MCQNNYDSLGFTLNPIKYCLPIIKFPNTGSKSKTIVAHKMKSIFGNKCWYCYQECENITLDHVIPKSKGGLLRYYNVVLCCDSCNHSKSNFSLFEFLGLLK
jgi:5-methylcytosine-specific restriction endonuclease McrA